MHAREIGSIQTKQDIIDKLTKIKNAIPEKFKFIHFHAYTINYGEKGEIKHLKHGETMPNGQEGKPNLDDFVTALKELDIDPWVISEAQDTQEIGAQYMLEKYKELK